jgi:hypothetical protein
MQLGTLASLVLLAMARSLPLRADADRQPRQQREGGTRATQTGWAHALPTGRQRLRCRPAAALAPRRAQFPLSPAGAAASEPSATTRNVIAAVTSSRTPSAAPRTSAASTPATTSSPPTSPQASPLPPLWRSGSKESWALNGILDVEASHLALSKTENVSERLVFKPVRLPQ